VVLSSPPPSRPEKSGGGKRGKIGGFSRSSRRRLREFILFSSFPEHLEPWAITLTVPGSIIIPSEHRRIFEVFTHCLRNAQIPAVWRLEVQERGQPHLHMIVGLRDPGEVPWLRDAWLRSLRKIGRDPVFDTFRDELTGARKFAFHADSFDGSGSWLRYISDHASKASYQEADGFGKHWGIICRSRFVSMPSIQVDLNSRQYAAVARWLRRLRRGSSRLHVSRRGNLGTGNAVLFTRTETIEKMMILAVQNYPGDPDLENPQKQLVRQTLSTLYKMRRSNKRPSASPPFTIRSGAL